MISSNFLSNIRKEADAVPDKTVRTGMFRYRMI